MAGIMLHAFTMIADIIKSELRIPVSLAPAGDEMDKNVTFPAIKDTGASECSITRRAARQIGAIACPRQQGPQNDTGSAQTSAVTTSHDLL